MGNGVKSRSVSHVLAVAAMCSVGISTMFNFVRGAWRRLMTLRVGLILATIFFPSAAMAQGIVGLSPEAPPPYSMRALGVNLSTTDVQLQHDDISIGSGDFPARLTLTRTYNAIGYPFQNLGKIAVQQQYLGFGQGSTHNLLAYFTRQRCANKPTRAISLTAVVFGRSFHFSGGGCIQSGPSVFVNDDDEGASMRIVDPNASILTYELITRDGLRVMFTDQVGYQYDTDGGRYAMFADFSNGDFIRFDYASSPTVSGTVRLAAIYNSRGYGLSFFYKTRARYFGANTMTDSSLVTSVTSFKQSGLNRSNINSVYYYYDSTEYVVSSYQNSSGGIYRYKYDIGRPTQVFFPNNTSVQPSVAISYFDGYSQVSSGTVSAGSPGAIFLLGVSDNVQDVAWSAPKSVTDGAGNVTQFEFSDITQPDPISVKVTTPDGNWTSYSTVFCETSPACTLSPYYSRSPSGFRDGLGSIWNYSYDTHGRILSAKNPEGGISLLTRDARGNITEVRNKPKVGDSSPDIVSVTGYDACTPNSYRYCNRPIYQIDPRGGRWDFQYDPLSGELAVSLAPADANGLRAVTRYSYSAFNAGPVTRPPLSNSSALYLLTAKDTCLTSGVSGSAVDFSYNCSGANRSRELYSYSPSGLELTAITRDADGVSATTAFSYDNAGNVTSSTDPKGGTAYSTYDPMRRRVYEIGIDPDGSGPLPRPIVRHVYDANGNEIRTETGNGLQTDGSDFSIVQFVRRTFDLNDRLIKAEEVTP